MPDKDIERAELATKKRRVFEMRQKLVPYRVIAEELNLSVNSVRSYYQEMRILLLPIEEVEEIRDRDIEGYNQSERTLNAAVEILAKQIEERMQSKGYADSRDLRLLGELEGQITDIRKARALLTGANTPIRVDHNMKVRVTFDEDIEALTSELLGGGNLLSPPDKVLIEDNE